MDYICTNREKLLNRCRELLESGRKFPQTQRLMFRVLVREIGTKPYSNRSIILKEHEYNLAKDEIGDLFNENKIYS